MTESKNFSTIEDEKGTLKQIESIEFGAEFYRKYGDPNNSNLLRIAVIHSKLDSIMPVSFWSLVQVVRNLTSVIRLIMDEISSMWSNLVNVSMSNRELDANNSQLIKTVNQLIKENKALKENDEKLFKHIAELVELIGVAGIVEANLQGAEQRGIFPMESYRNRQPTHQKLTTQEEAEIIKKDLKTVETTMTFIKSQGAIGSSELRGREEALKSLEDRKLELQSRLEDLREPATV